MVLSQQQLNARRNFIGSSEASIIANGSYSSWYELIEQKRNSLEKIFDKPKYIVIIRNQSTSKISAVYQSFYK